MYFQAEIDPNTRHYLSEDYWFTQKLHEIRVRTWLCPWMQLSHQGSLVFQGSVADQRQLASLSCDRPLVRSA